MTLTAPATNGTTASGRTLLTELPGPRSRELHAARERAVPRGFGVVLPVFVDRADGGLLVDVDGNRLIDMASGIAVTSVGASRPARSRRGRGAGGEVHTHLLHGHRVRRLRGRCAGAQPADARRPREAHRAVHHRRRGRRERGEDRPRHTGRPAVVVLDHAYHGRTLMTMSMTAKNVPYKEGFGPFAPEVYRAPVGLPVPLAGRPRERRRGGARGARGDGADPDRR